MEAEHLMQAVLQSFLDADLQVEVVPRLGDKCQGRTANIGTGPSYDATTQANGRLTTNYKRPEPAQVNSYSGHQADSTTQAVDGQYATVYRVHHCKMTPTSPTPMPSEFPPQRPDVAYGCDNFQVGGTGSGETGGAPLKTSSYRGAGLNWPSRDEVYTRRLSRCSDSFARSLRQYPSMTPERSAEVLERLVTYAMPRTYRSPRHSPHRSPQREPGNRKYEDYRPRAPEEDPTRDRREEFSHFRHGQRPSRRHSSHRSPQREAASPKYEDYRPRAPEEDPTRDRREEFSQFRQANKQAFAKQEDIRNIREMSRRLRKSLKSISSYTHTQTLSTYMDGAGVDRECDTPILETSETEHEDQPASYSYPVNTTVQAVVPTTSLGVEAKPLPISNRTIAVPLTPTPSRLVTQTDAPHAAGKSVAPTTSLGTDARPLSTSRTRTIAVPVSPTSSRLATRAHDISSSLVTRSVQTFRFLGRSVETVTSTTELPKHESVKIIVKKSKSVSDFRLYRDFKSEIIAWLDDNNDPKIDELKEVVLKDLSFRLQGVSTAGVDKINVKIGNCLKSCGKRDIKKPLRFEFNKKKICNCTQNHYVLNPTEAKLVMDQSKLKDVIKGSLPNISVKNHDFMSRLVQKDKILDTFIDRLNNLAIDKSKHCGEQTTKEGILRILDKLLFEVNTCDKTAFLNKLTDYLMCELKTPLLGDSKTEPSPCNVIENSNTNETRTDIDVAEERVKDVVENEIKEGLNPDVIKQAIEDLVDILKDSLNNNIELEAKANKLHKTTEKVENCGDMHYKKYSTNFTTQPLTVFMVQNFSRNFVKKPSGTSISQHRLEANLNRYKTQLAEHIDQWLSDLAILRAEDTNFRRAVVLDLASDIVDRQKYLQFNKNMHSYIDEIEHLKYLVFKWIKRYVGEENMETVNHAVELMKMIRNIPVPELSRSQDLLNKCNNRKKDQFGSGPSPDIGKNNVYNSKSDSGIHDRGGSQSDSAHSRAVIGNVCSKPNLGRSVSNNSVSSKCNETVKQQNQNLKRISSQTQNSFDANNIITKNVVPNIRESNNINKEEHSSQDSFVSSRSKDNLQEACSDTRCKNCNDDAKSGTTTEMSKDDTNTPMNYNKNNNQKNFRYTSYLFHKFLPNNTNERRNKREDKHKRNSVKNSSKKSEDLEKCEPSCSKPGFKPTSCCKNVTSVPSQAGKPSSAVAQLMADWRPPPVFTPPPPGRPLRDQVYEEFKEYLKKWCQQIPIPANTTEEIEAAEKYRLGIINGVWKMLTKLKTQPAVFQNKFYYEDVLGKEIDGLLECLPQTQELQEKKYPLKAQLLEKISDMNDLIKEIEMPDNYKEIIAQREKILKDQHRRGFIRQTVRSDREDPEKIMEEMFKYCILDDFLKLIDYKETNNFLAKAYKNRLLKRIQEYLNEVKTSHGKNIEEICDCWQEDDIFQELKKVPIPTENNTKAEADEILLGLEIEQWMLDLPIVKNDDENEQRHRARLRDELTKNIKEMDRRVDISECCGDAQLRHEISYFLDMVPLEKDQDLKINEMVEDLTNRLNRHKSGGRRKSVAFQDGSLYQHGNQSNRLINRNDLSFKPAASSDIDSPKEQRMFGENDDIQIRGHVQDAPLCSTRIEQPIQWENEDEPFRAFREGAAAASSFIEPRSGFQFSTPQKSSNFHHSIDQEPLFDFPPAKLHESARGSLSHSHHGSHPEESYHYPNVMGSPMQNAPISDSQYQSLQEAHSSIPAEHPQYIPAVDHQGTPRVRRAWSQRDSSFKSMLESGAPRSPAQMSHAPCASHGPAVCSRHRSQIHPNKSLPQAERSSQGYTSMISHRAPQLPGEVQQPSFHSARNDPFVEPHQYPPSFHSSRNELYVEPQSYIEPQQQSRSFHSPRNEPFDEPQLYIEPQQQPPSYHSRQNDSYIETEHYIEPQQQPASFHSSRNERYFEPFVEPQPAYTRDQPRFSREPRSHRKPCPSMCQEQEDSVPTVYNRDTPEPLEVAVQVHEAPRQRPASPRFISAVSQQRPIKQPLETSHNLRPPMDPNSGQPSIRLTPARDQDEIQQAPESFHRSHIIHRQGPVPSRQTTRNQASREPSERPGMLASNAPNSEISNRPNYYSTPNRDAIPPPHNMRERRQLEKERPRRIDMDAEEDGEERCHCRARFREWSARPNCHTCDDCMQGRFFPYPFPYPHPPPNMYQPYMFPPFGRPPHPPHCRR